MPIFFLATWASRLGLMKKHQITKSMPSEHAVAGILAIPPSGFLRFPLHYRIGSLRLEQTFHKETEE